MIATLASVAMAIVSPQLTRLPNGIPIVVEQQSQPYVFIQVLVKANDLSPTELGALEIVSAALFGETTNFSLRELKKLAWSAGGGISSTFAGDCVRLQLTTTKDRLAPAASLINEALRNPTFDDGILQKAISANKLHQQQIDRTVPLREIRNALALKKIGPASVGEISREYATALHLKVFRPGRIFIAAVGPVTPESIATALGGTLGNWQPQRPREPIGFKADERRSTSIFETALVTVRGPSPREAAFPAWLVACVAVGEGKRGLLNKVFRVDRGLSYVLGQTITARDNASYATFYVSTETGKRPSDLLQIIKSAPLLPADVQRAKALAIGRYKVGGIGEISFPESFANDHRTPSSRAFWLAWWEMQGESFSKDKALLSEIEKVSDDEVASVRSMWHSPGY